MWFFNPKNVTIGSGVDQNKKITFENSITKSVILQGAPKMPLKEMCDFLTLKMLPLALVYTGWFRKGAICSGINKIAFYCSSKVALLDIQNSKVYNFIHMTR